MTVIALVLGLTDFVLLAVILKYGNEISKLKRTNNPNDGSYVYNETLEYEPVLNPPSKPFGSKIKFYEELEKIGLLPYDPDYEVLVREADRESEDKNSYEPEEVSDAQKV